MSCGSQINSGVVKGYWGCLMVRFYFYRTHGAIRHAGVNRSDNGQASDRKKAGTGKNYHPGKPGGKNYAKPHGSVDCTDTLGKMCTRESVRAKWVTCNKYKIAQ